MEKRLDFLCFCLLLLCIIETVHIAVYLNAPAIAGNSEIIKVDVVRVSGRRIKYGASLDLQYK